MISLRLAFVFLTIFYVSAQPCVKITDCNQCKQTSGCGYCDIPGGIGACFPSVSETVCNAVGRWNPTTCSPPIVSDCVKATDCNSCLNLNVPNVNFTSPVNSTANNSTANNSTSSSPSSTNSTNTCGWCDLGDIGVCHNSNATCNAFRGAFFTDKCPTGTNCGNYSSCQQCAQDKNCTSCQITPTTFTCVSAAQKELYCPSAFYRQGASCNVSAAALTCASRTTCEQCSGNSTAPNNSTQSNNTQSNNSTQTSCGWCNFGSTRGGECFSTQDNSFCSHVGLWNEPCPAPGAPNTCTNVTNLQFCTASVLPNSMNTTDMPWVLKLHDSYYNLRFNDIKTTLQQELKNNNIDFCDDCFNAYQKFLCAAASPGCGMANCYQNAIASATDCIAACPCESNSQFVVQPTCFDCVTSCTADAVAQPCGQFGVSKRTCIQLVNICGCNPSQQDANTICSDFADNGIFFDLGNGSCTSTPTWCGAISNNQTNFNNSQSSNFNNSQSSNFNSSNSSLPPLNSTALEQPQPGRLCPNAHTCLSVYNALGANVIANPVTTLQGVDNNGNPGNNGTGGNNGNSAAVSNCASPLLLLAALFLLMFV